jgi:hypothetical protein
VVDRDKTFWGPVLPQEADDEAFTPEQLENIRAERRAVEDARAQVWSTHHRLESIRPARRSGLVARTPQVTRVEHTANGVRIIVSD